jgi:hypothetical protein
MHDDTMVRRLEADQATEGARVIDQERSREAEHRHATYDDPPRKVKEHWWQFWRR